MLRDNNKNQHLRPPSAALIFDDGEILWGYGFGALKAVETIAPQYFTIIKNQSS